MSKQAMYRFIPLDVWEATEEVTDSEGNITPVRTCEDVAKYPNARVSVNEVVISCNDDSGTHTKEEALAHIEANWPKQEEPTD
ncbi:hypothetical protein CTH30272_02109 [Allocatenococcus thiocycli]|nr:hypothetical protein CTH30272_02109 [Catenococcus thiocycli]